MGRLLMANDIPTRAPVPLNAKKLHHSLLDNTTNFAQIVHKDAIGFQKDYDYTLDQCMRRSRVGEGVPWPRYGEGEGLGYYLSSYGFSKACLHQALRVLANKDAGEGG